MLRHCKFICIVPLHYWPQESKPGKVPSTVPVQCSAMAVGGGYGAREESQAPFDTTAFQKCNTGVSGSCSCPSIFKLMQLNQYKFLHACLLCPDLFQSNQKKMRVYSYIFFFPGDYTYPLQSLAQSLWLGSQSYVSTSKHLSAGGKEESPAALRIGVCLHRLGPCVLNGRAFSPGAEKGWAKQHSSLASTFSSEKVRLGACQNPHK